MTDSGGAQSALIVVVPEAEPLVGRFRRRFDPSSAAGVPAHVTVLYPFLPPSRLTAKVLRSLEQLFADQAPFRAKLARTRRFPGTLYLAPVPAQSFRRLTRLVFDRFPQSPPYEGRFSDVVPHLTVADGIDSDRLAEIAVEFAAAARSRLPVRTTVAEVVLIERRAGKWRRRRTFPLGRARVARSAIIRRRRSP